MEPFISIWHFVVGFFIALPWAFLAGIVAVIADKFARQKCEEWVYQHPAWQLLTVRLITATAVVLWPLYRALFPPIAQKIFGGNGSVRTLVWEGSPWLIAIFIVILGVLISYAIDKLISRFINIYH